MSAKPTPGPWCVGYVRPQRVDKSLQPMVEVPIHVGEFSNRGNCLAIAYAGGRGALHSDEADVLANARLIAAAPELLAALEEIRDRTLLDAEGPELRAQNANNYRCALRAIAKATGEQP